ncbi:hypothetical protein ACFQAT_25265 [Undibacterium arcticum]|uniref:hypothetical protein n=1 Tax=Undibacterium arcticum TaxID=1762892 RepID=UPI00361972F5
MLLALPLQGVAAATMMPCAETHGHTAATAMGALPDASPDHHHQQQDIAAAHDDGQASHDHSSAPDHQSDAKCSHCSVCCVGAALLPPTLNVSPVFHSLTLQLASAALLFSGTSPDRLERPPRLILV